MAWRFFQGHGAIETGMPFICSTVVLANAPTLPGHKQNANSNDD